MNQMIPLEEESEDGGPCLTALAAFVSSDSSMTASSEAEGTICGGTSLTVVAILFYLLDGKKIKVLASGRRKLCHSRDLLVGDKARDFTMAEV